MTQNDSKVVRLSTLKAACQHCNLRELCLPLGLDEPDMRELNRVIRRRRQLRKGEMLYRPGDALRSLYAVRRGAFKTTAIAEDGSLHITGFFLPGELLGLDAITADRHPCSAEALEASEVCDIPFQALEDLAHRLPSLQRQLLKLMSREILRDERLLVVLGSMTAEERLASSLLSFSRRHGRLGLSETDINLHMSRQDLAMYLGLAFETVSRLFTRFEEQGLIEANGRYVRLRDMDGLRALANPAHRPAGAS